MLLLPQNEPKFLKMLRIINTKFSERQLKMINQKLSIKGICPTPNSTIKLYNPFKGDKIPPLTDEQLERTILYMAKQMDEIHGEQLNDFCFELFIEKYYPRLILVLSQRHFHCAMFCYTVIRYLQERQKGSQLENHFYQKGPLRLLNLFSEVLERRKTMQMSASVTSKENADEIHNIFCVVLLLASIKYIQSNEELIKQSKYIEFCLKISVDLIHQAEKPPQFAILRELLSVASNLLIFNGMSVRPSYFAEFCLDSNLLLHDHEQYKEIIDEQVIERYFECLKVFIKLDPKYQKSLTITIKKLIYLNISNPMFFRHVDILLLLIQEKVFPSINAQFHTMLIQAENSINSKLIDQIYDKLHRNGIQILPQEIQTLNIKLAEKGSNQRKKNCANAYYNLYIKNNGKILQRTVNFILETYLTQNLVLDNIESMMIGCANAIFSNNLERLHQLIGENKYIELLSSVLEKRTNCFNSRQQNRRFSFVQEDWLLAAGRNLEIYRTYLKIVVNMLCGSIDIASERLSSQPICIQEIHRSRCEQFFAIILRSAEKSEIFDEEIFRYIVLCQVILGEHLPVQTYSYFSKYISLASNEKSNFLHYLQLLLTIFKTSSSVILYLHTLLDAEDNMPDYFHLKKLYHLNLLANMVQESQYFKINAFSFQGIVLLYELSLKVKGQEFQKDIVTIMTTWCSHLTRVDARNLCYLFIYREIKKAYPFIKQYQMEEPIGRLKELWKTILLFLDQGKTTRSYLKMAQNKIILQSKTQEEHKRIKIQGSFLINIQLQHIWTICIETSIKKYKISIVKNQVIITTNEKSGKQMEKVTRFLVKEQERSSIFQQSDKSVLDFILQIQAIQKDKIVTNLRISEFQPLQLRLIGSVLEISIETHNQMILKSIKIMDFASPGIFHSISQHFHSINQWLIKTKKLRLIKTSSFSDKFDFDHAYCYFIEMLKHFNHISISLVFDIFVKLSLIIVKYIQNEVSNNNKKPAIFIQTFNLLEQTYPEFRSKYRELSPTIDITNSFEYSRPLYYLMVSGLLPVCFWRHFRKQTRRIIERLLVEIMDASEFRTLENNRLQFFDRCLQLAQYQLAQHTSRIHYQSDEQLKFVSFFLQKCNEIIISHPLNHILGFKIKKMIFSAKKKDEFQDNLKLLIKQIIKFLTIQNIKYNRQRQASRFIVINFEYIHHLFLFCDIEDQLNIIHYLSQTQTDKIRSSKPHLAVIQLASLIEDEQKNRLISWIIVQLKMYLFMFMKRDMAIQQNDTVLSFLNFYLQLLFTYRQFCSEQQIDNMYKVIEEALNVLINQLNIEKGKLKHQHFFEVRPYAVFFVHIETEIINKYEDLNERKLKKKKDIHLRIEYSLLKLISIKFTKKTFLAFMIVLRRKCINNPKLIIAILNHQQFSKLKLYHFSIFLQFIVEILMIIDIKSPLTAKQNKQIAQYVYCFIHNIIPTEGSKKNLPEISRYLFYAFPRLTCSSYYYQEGMEESLQRFKNVQTKKVIELGGGIYFKCLLIIIKLMKLSPQQDYSDIIQYFLIGKDVGGSQKPSNRMQQKSQQIRHAIDRYMAECVKEHKNYYNEFDIALMLQVDSTAIHSYIVDYFLMNFAQYLQTYSGNINDKLLKKYNAMFVQCCSQESIWNDILSSQPNPSKINTYETAISELKKDPTYRASRDQEKIDELPDLTLSHGKSAKFNYEAKDVIGSLLLQRRRTEKASYDDEKKKAQVFGLIKKNHKNWFKQPDCSNISLFFDDKAKEIRLIELIHTHFVLKSKERPSQKKDSDFKKKVQEFQSIYKEKLNQERTQVGKTLSYLEQKARKVKKIFPYTCRRIPVLKIMQNCLANMSIPLTSKFVVDEYDAAYCESQMSINMNYFISTANHIVGDFQSHREITEEFFQHHEDVPFQIKVQKNEEVQEQRESSIQGSVQVLKQGNFCELITREGAYFCEYQIKEKALKLVTKDKRPENQFWYLKVGTPQDNIIKIGNQEITIFFEDAYEILYRKYNQITNNSLEIFYKNGTSKFITFYIKKLLSPFVKKLQEAVKGLRIIKDPVRHFEQQKYTQKWVNGYLSNFDYLMLLNKYSSRTYNDLNQYYVFPWVLQNYTTQSMDLTNTKNYRDLSKPIGALNAEQLGQFMEKYYMENLSQRCLYRSHYSTQAFVFYYLFRLEPYSSLYRKLQGDQWDDADRLFSSVSQVWASLTDKKQDLKECLPEFYYFPTFLKNVSNIQFGKRQCGTKVNDVQLPAWCSSPEQFVITMRAALESDYVSENLHLWIDLIFGKHQNSIERLNVFRPLSYADPQIYSKIKNLSDAQIKGHVTEISYFGQCPLQIFKKDHRPKMRRKPNEEILTPSNSFINKEYLSIFGWKIISLQSDEYNFFLELSDKKQKQWISMPVLASQYQMKISISSLNPIERILPRKQSGIDVKINAKYEMTIGSEYIMDILVRFEYSHVVSNEMWIACFGSKGIKIYNWEMVQQWSWLKDQVRQLYLEATKLIFSTPCGKLYFYSFLNRKIEELVVFEETCDMKIRVAPLPRLPCSQKNLIQYRILCIGDQTKVAMVHHNFQQTCNFTSNSVRTH